MSQGINRLSTRGIDAAKAGEHFDGGGLMLRVSPKGKKVWIWRFSFGEARVKHKLGVYPAMKLAEARELRNEGAGFLEEGLDPRIEWQRIKDEANAVKEKVKPRTFGEFVTDQLPRVTAKFENPKHVQQWHSTFRTYCAEKPIWTKPLSEVNQDDVADCIVPIWRKKRETASRLRGRVENMIDVAKARGFYKSDNPAAWKVQQHIVPELTKAERAEKHHTALEYSELPRFWRDLSAREVGPARHCLQLVILTALRSSEVREADWSEIDLEKNEWSIPGQRMKMRVPHVVPITQLMRELLLATPFRDGLIFRNPVGGNVLSNNAMLSLIKRMGAKAHDKNGERITPHGFRSTFNDYIGDATEFDEILVEFQLAHAVQGVKRHYRRSTALDRRIEMMRHYSDFVTGQAELEMLAPKVVNL